MISYQEFAAAGRFLTLPSHSTALPVPDGVRLSRSVPCTMPDPWTMHEECLPDSSIERPRVMAYEHVGIHRGVAGGKFTEGFIVNPSNSVIKRFKVGGKHSAGYPFQIVESHRFAAIYSVVGARSEARNDAATFLTRMPGVRMPHVWGDSDEVVLEWMYAGKHAIVSFVGDGRLGYTLLVGDSFVPGTVEDASVQTVPADLEAYLKD